ncbi:6-phosphogluconolactonase [Daejeonella rubra]|uniref:6-phosphogluconolactonase n=1 Tax=Daejeonella rubra TaxID=990371 RepID=A0A1G9LPE1_9SPHI|nr:lactonase family protein [Daejeonella rubra]SDL63800.1 6-phosphogluconolactonase [Daejeonella rubra]
MEFKKIISFCALLLVAPALFAQSEKYHMLVGTYTSPGKSEGIYVYEFDSQNGEISYKSKVILESPSYFAVSPDRKFVYSVTEGKESKINALAFDPQSGDLKLLNSQPSGSNGPTHISVDAKRKYVFASNYGGGSITALPIDANGTLGPDIQDIKHQGSSIARKKPFVHSAVVSPDNKYVLTADLGTDKINIYRFNAKKRPLALSAAAQPFLTLDPGAGPRHSTFHPNKKFFYAVTEINSRVYAFNYKKGHLTQIQSVSMIPEGFTGPGHGSDIHISADGKFLYASTRSTVNEIGIYSIDQKTGMLSLVAKQPSFGKSSRTFEIDPSGNWLLSTSQVTNEIIVFKRDKESGKLTPTGQKLQIDKPSLVKFVKMD